MNPAKDVAEGKPVRSPLHPALVHLPIAFFPLGVLLDLASWLFADVTLRLVPAAFIAIAIGIATALAAAVAGFVDYTSIRDDHPAKKTATLHMILNLISVGLFAAGLGLRADALDQDRTPVLPLLLSLAALGVLGYSGYLGGALVYDDGIGVGRHRRRTPLPGRTITGKPAENARGVATTFLVGRADDVPEGGTTRVDAAGTIITVARHQGELHAFQEYCPHRYGPLSEGRIADGEVVCPWHCSRFKLATGEVAHGPAKIGLRTVPVELRDGQIWVRVSG